MLWRLQKLLYGLELRHVALRFLEQENFLRMGFRGRSANPRRLHRLRGRLLPRLQRHAALRRFARRYARPFAARPPACRNQNPDGPPQFYFPRRRARKCARADASGAPGLTWAGLTW